MAVPTPTLPIILQYGLIAVRGVAPASPINDIRSPNNFYWGTIDNIADAGIITAIEGNYTMFDASKVICKITYNDIVYTILKEADVIAFEEASAPAP